MAGVSDFVPNWSLDNCFNLYDEQTDDEELLKELDKVLTNQAETTDGLKTTDTVEKSVVEKFLDDNKNVNTARKTKTDLNVWRRWCQPRDETREIEDIPPSELDGLLCLFFIEAKKQNAADFEPGTLTSFQRSLDRHLRQKSKPYSILSDRQFSKSRETLECKRRQLRLAGKGRRPNKALGLNSNEMEKLWLEKQLGDHSPDALIRTIWLNNTMHFGWRAQDEHRKVLLGDLEIQKEQGGDEKEYVIWHTERGSKTRTGGKEFGPERYYNPRMYATGNDRSRVSIIPCNGKECED
ncbi:hypothetical protein QZH41_007975 [Actinostola sp. cb2023]|nr:hypothetical protein QZH41_007975 [Actinostola sp. cb2023]